MYQILHNSNGFFLGVVTYVSCKYGDIVVVRHSSYFGSYREAMAARQGLVAFDSIPEGVTA